MSTWVRRWQVPRATHSRIRLPARSSVDSGKYGRIVSVSMRLMRVGARRMPHPWQARQRLVEMHVAIDQPRQYEIAADVECRSAVRRSRRRAFADNRNLPVGDADIDNTTIGEPALDQECAEHYGLLLGA